MKIKTILTSIMLVFGMSLFTYAEPVSMGQGNSKSPQQLTELVNLLTIKKFSGTIKWSKNKVSKSTTIATVNTTVEDLSFIDEKGLILGSVLGFVETDWHWNAVNLVKINKSKTVAKFLAKYEGGKHLVIMKLKKGVFTMIIKNKGAENLDEMLGLTNTATEGWATKSLNVNLAVSRNGTAINGSGTVTFDYKTKQDKVTKIKISKGVI